MRVPREAVRVIQLVEDEGGTTQLDGRNTRLYLAERRKGDRLR